AVLRMLEQYLGAERFRDGIRRYLDEHRYGNAETTDLWDAIEETTGEPVRATMDSWIFQGGHPLVTVSVAGDGRTLELDQRPFRYLTGGGGGSPWHVPVLYRTEVGGLPEQGRLLLSGPGARAELSGPPDLVLVNAGGSGVDRVDRVLPGEDRPRLQALVRGLAGPLFAQLGWQPAKDEPERRGLLRATLLRALGTIGADPDVRARAAELHGTMLQDSCAVDPQLLGALV